MSCLPEIFMPSKSRTLQQSVKIGGPFSINLRSGYFNGFRNASQQDGLKSKQRIVERSLDGQRYRSDINKQQSFRSSKSGSKGFTRKASFQKTFLEQNGHANSNLNNRNSHQSEIEAISSFNTLKRNLMDTIHLSHRILELTDQDLKSIQLQLSEFRVSQIGQLDKFRQQFLLNCQQLTKQFRHQRRQVLTQNKTIGQQIVYLTQEIQTAQDVSRQVHDRFKKVTQQFL